MFKALMRARDSFLGIGEADTSVPVFDGALKPNNLLETAPVFLAREGLDDLCVDASGRLFVSAGNAILSVSRDATTEVAAQLPETVQALAAFRGGLAAATRGGLHFIGGQLDGKTVQLEGGASAACIDALSASPDGALLISIGSQTTACADWSRDLLSRGRTGRLLEYAPESGEFRVLRQNMAYCYGVCADQEQGRVLLSESWAHRVLVLESSGSNGKSGKSSVGFGEIPGYPSRIVPASAASGGGFWLTVFAPRSQLLEFVLREDAYRQEMMETIEPKYWIAPAYSSGWDFLEPLQQGSVRHMGILKPWAPPRSYGLVVRLGQDLLPRYSLHSRVGGRHHGITAVAEFDGALLALSKGASSLLRIPLSDMEKGVTA